MRERWRGIQRVNRALIHPVKVTIVQIILVAKYAGRGYAKAWRKELP
jgi:hypothetical protein